MLMNGGGKKLDLILRSGPKDRVSKDASRGPWFETRGFAALLTMRDFPVAADSDLILRSAPLRASRRMAFAIDAIFRHRTPFQG
jgi:hypothetical protein